LSLAQSLDNFDSKNFLDIKKIFKNKKFISLDEKILKRIND
jgi:hypothetical protein